MADSFDLDIDISQLIRNLRITDTAVEKGGKRGVNDSIDEIIRISSDIAPLDKGILHKAHSREVTVSRGTIKAAVSYFVQENGHNYALQMHEGEYNLGEGSRARPGTTGWSGKHYNVGNKYLERPMKGEEEAILKHIADEIKREIGG